MIPQLKNEQFDPWGHVEQRRSPAANDTRYDDLIDGKTEGNWTMLFVGIISLVAIFVIVLSAAAAVCTLAWKYRAELIASVSSFPWHYGAGVLAAAGAGLAFFVVRRLRDRRRRREEMLHYLDTTIAGGSR